MLTVERLRRQLGLLGTDTSDDDLLTWCVDATNEWVLQTPYVAGHVAVDPMWPWPAEVLQGATMLAARLYRRRNTPSGIESYTDQVVYLPRRDGDVDLLLHLGRPVAG